MLEAAGIDRFWRKFSSAGSEVSFPFVTQGERSEKESSDGELQGAHFVSDIATPSHALASVAAPAGDLGCLDGHGVGDSGMARQAQEGTALADFADQGICAAMGACMRGGPCLTRLLDRAQLSRCSPPCVPFTGMTVRSM